MIMFEFKRKKYTKKEFEIELSYVQNLLDEAYETVSIRKIEEALKHYFNTLINYKIDSEGLNPDKIREIVNSMKEMLSVYPNPSIFNGKKMESGSTPLFFVPVYDEKTNMIKIQILGFVIDEENIINNINPYIFFENKSLDEIIDIISRIYKIKKEYIIKTIAKSLKLQIGTVRDQHEEIYGY